MPVSLEVRESYYTYLGKFINAFAVSELMFHTILREYCISCTRKPYWDPAFLVLQSLIGEMSIKVVTDNITRLVKTFSKEDAKKLQDILAKYGEIHAIRDKLAHKPAAVIAKKKEIWLQVATLMTANSSDKTEIIEFRISTLSDMEHDLPILTAKVIHLLKLGKVPSFLHIDDVEALSQTPLRYKPSSLERKKGNMRIAFR